MPIKKSISELRDGLIRAIQKMRRLYIYHDHAVILLREEYIDIKSTRDKLKNHIQNIYDVIQVDAHGDYLVIWHTSHIIADCHRIFPEDDKWNMGI